MSDWIHAREAAELIGGTPRHIMRLARRGVLTVRRIPAMRPAYLRSEVVALAETSICKGSFMDLDAEPAARDTPLCHEKSPPGATNAKRAVTRFRGDGTPRRPSGDPLSGKGPLR
jgi:hypothetical protein